MYCLEYSSNKIATIPIFDSIVSQVKVNTCTYFENYDAYSKLVALYIKVFFFCMDEIPDSHAPPICYCQTLS